MKVTPGDLVEVGGIWNMKGIVLADETAWYVIADHYDIAGCIVAKTDIRKVLKPGAVDPEVLPYLRHQP